MFKILKKLMSSRGSSSGRKHRSYSSSDRNYRAEDDTAALIDEVILLPMAVTVIREKGMEAAVNPG